MVFGNAVMIPPTNPRKATTSICSPAAHTSTYPPPSPHLGRVQTYELFDNILLLAEGKVIYHGPREDIVPYFNGIG